jgi:hypothetical protein
MEAKMNHVKEMNHVETAALGRLPREARPAAPQLYRVYLEGCGKSLHQ